MSSTRLSEYLDHQALVAKLADVSEQCYKLLQLCNDLEKNLNDHNTDPEAHLDIRKAIEVVSGRLDTANTTFNTYITNIRNTYDAEVAELKKKDTELENNLGEVSEKLDTVEKGEHVYDNSIKSEVVADDILAAAKGDAIIQSTTDKDGVVMLASLESPSGIYTLGSNHDEFEVNFHSDSDLAKNSPAATQSVVLLDKDGNSKFGKNVSAEQFTGKLVGDVTGNAATASNSSKFNGLVTSDFARTTGNVNQTVTGTKTFSSPIVGNLQGTADNADKLDNLDSSDFVRKTNNVAETITGNKTFSAIVYGDNFQPKSGNKTGTIGTSSNGYKTIYVEHVEASTIIGDVTGALTGNADSATQLRTPRKINGTDFDGTTAIVTEIWGTTRNFYIADSTGKHTGIPIGVNGSGTVTLRLPGVIKADLIGNLNGNVTGNATSATKLQTARSLWGNNFDGSQNLSGNIHFTNDNLTGVVVGAIGKVGNNDFWRVGGGATANDSGFMELATADNGTEPIYVRQYTGEYTTITRTATLLDASGNTQFPGTVTAPTFSGNVTGNAATATRANSAANADTATNASAANQLQAFVNDNFTSGNHYVKAIRSSQGWSTHLWMCYNNGAKMADAVSVNYANLAGNAGYATNANYANSAGYATNATRFNGHSYDEFRSRLLGQNYNDVGSTILAGSTVLFAGGSSGAYGDVVAGSNLNRPYNCDQDGGGFCGNPPSCPGTWVRVSSFSYDYNGKYIGLFRRIA